MAARNRTRTLSTVIGSRRSKQDHANQVAEALKGQLHRPAFTSGLNRFYTEDNAELANMQRNADEYKTVPLTVEDALTQIRDAQVPSLDIVAEQDATNTIAKASVVVDGETLLEDVPISFLLHVERVVAEWRSKIIEILPVHDPAKTWTYDTQNRFWRSRQEKRNAYMKEVVPVVLHQGTDKHPPQVQAVQKDIYAGYWTEEHLSGGITAARKRQLLANADKFLIAVRDAIADANATPAVAMPAGEKIFGVLLAE